MAKEDNLIPGKHKLTVDEQSKGGIKSAEAYRQKKTLSELAKPEMMIMSCNNIAMGW